MNSYFANFLGIAKAWKKMCKQPELQSHQHTAALDSLLAGTDLSLAPHSADYWHQISSQCGTESTAGVFSSEIKKKNII